MFIQSLWLATKVIPDQYNTPYLNDYSTLVLAPLILLSDLGFLFGGEIVFDSERWSDLLVVLASLEHISDGLDGDLEQSFDVQVVRSQHHFDHLRLPEFLQFTYITSELGLVIGHWSFKIFCLGSLNPI